MDPEFSILFNFSIFLNNQLITEYLESSVFLYNIR